MDEAQEFARIHIACWREAYGEIVPAAILDAADVADRTESWTSILRDPAKFACGAYAEDRPIGFVMANRLPESSLNGADGRVGAIYVLQRYHRQGVGRTLLNAAARWWLEQDGRCLEIQVLADNGRARAFYEAMGGTLVSTGLYKWHGFDLAEAKYNFTNLEELAAVTPSPSRG